MPTNVKRWFRRAAIGVGVLFGLVMIYTAVVMMLIPGPGPTTKHVEGKLRLLVDTPEGRRALKEAADRARATVQATRTPTSVPPAAK